MKFWKRNKPDHDCRDHCGHTQALNNMVESQIFFENHDCNKTCNHIVTYKNHDGFVEFFKEVMQVKKYQLLAKKYNLEFEFGEDI